MKSPLALLRDAADHYLRMPQLRGMSGADFDTVRAAEAERSVYEAKPILHVLYDEYCRPFVASAATAPADARMIEIGSGTSPLKRRLPNLVTSDVMPFPWLDLSCSAYQLPFADQSIDRFFLLFVMHHLGRLEDFFDEAVRCLKPGGEMVIVDPAITPFSKLYYKIHVDEMDVETTEWGFDGSGRLTDSNIALAWIAFFRDRERFEKRYPHLEIVKVEYNTTVAFLLSGGFRIRQLLPTMLLAPLFRFENWLIRNVSSKLAVTMAVTIRRR